MAANKEFENSALEQYKFLNEAERFQAGIQQFNLRFFNTFSSYKDYEQAKNKASLIRKKVINQLDQYLVEFEANFKKNGGHIYWANSIDEVKKEVLQILSAKGIKNVLLGNQAIIAEAEVSDFLEQQKISYCQLDPFNDLLAKAKESANHPVQNAAHISQEVLAKQVESNSLNADRILQDWHTAANAQFENQLFNAEAVITGAHFLTVDVGGVAIFDALGGVSKAFSLAAQRIVIVGIEQLLPQLNDLYLFSKLYAHHTVGNHLLGNLNIYNGSNFDQPEMQGSLHVILLNNGRTDLLAHPTHRILLENIGFETLVNFDYLHQSIGSKSYMGVYKGAAGGIFSSYLGNLPKDIKAIFASLPSGSIEKYAPIHIPLREIYIAEREQLALVQKSDTDLLWRSWRNAMLNRKFLNRSNLGLISLMKTFFKRGWSNLREFPSTPKQSFNEQWVKARPVIIKSNKITEIPKGTLLIKKSSD